MGPGNDFKLLACNALIASPGSFRFPAEASNVLRGALGFHLDESLFRPRLAAGPSGLRDAVRGFVLRASHLNGKLIETGDFSVGVNLFSEALENHFRLAFASLAEAGIGPARTPLTLSRWTSSAIEINLSEPESARAVRVHFDTPTELKGWDGKGLIPFDVLACRLRDRISALRSFFGPGPLDIDFQAFGRLAGGVRATGGQLNRQTARRRSSRSGQTHPLGGLTGWVDFEGPLDAFLPYLRAGYHTGAGRQTVWGHGVIRAEILA